MKKILVTTGQSEKLDKLIRESFFDEATSLPITGNKWNDFKNFMKYVLGKEVKMLTSHTLRHPLSEDRLIAISNLRLALMSVGETQAVEPGAHKFTECECHSKDILHIAAITNDDYRLDPVYVKVNIARRLVEIEALQLIVDGAISATKKAIHDYARQIGIGIISSQVSSDLIAITGELIYHKEIVRFKDMSSLEDKHRDMIFASMFLGKEGLNVDDRKTLLSGATLVMDGQALYMDGLRPTIKRKISELTAKAGNSANIQIDDVVFAIASLWSLELLDSRVKSHIEDIKGLRQKALDVTPTEALKLVKEKGDF